MCLHRPNQLDFRVVVFYSKRGLHTSCRVQLPPTHHSLEEMVHKIADLSTMSLVRNRRPRSRLRCLIAAAKIPDCISYCKFFVPPNTYDTVLLSLIFSSEIIAIPDTNTNAIPVVLVLASSVAASSHSLLIHKPRFLELPPTIARTKIILTCAILYYSGRNASQRA